MTIRRLQLRTPLHIYAHKFMNYIRTANADRAACSFKALENNVVWKMDGILTLGYTHEYS